MLRRTVALSALVAIALAVVALGAAPAWAHATLQGTDPSAGAQFRSGHPPTAVTILFDERVTIPAHSIEVFDSRGQVVKIGAATHGANDSRVTAGLPRLPDGTYVVTYRVVSDDSHPIQGAFTFGIGKAAGSAIEATALLSGQSGSRRVGIVFGIVRAFAYFGVLVMIGGVAFVRWGWPNAGPRRDVRGLLFAMTGLAIASAVIGMGLQGAYANGGGLGDIANGTAIRGVLHTHFGEAWRLRAILSIAFFPIVALLARPLGRTAHAIADSAFVLLAIAIAETFTYAGHGNTGRLVHLGTITDVVHVLAAAVWLGGVVVLAVALRSPEEPEGAARAAERFARIALPAIVIIALSGTVQAWRQIETWPALWHTVYARLLLAKVLLVGGIVVVASASRDILRFRVVPAVRNTVGVSAAWAEAPPDDVRDLRNAIWVEVLLAVVVLCVTAGLVNSEPAREAAASAPRTYQATLPAGAMQFRLGIQPTLPGQDTIVVTVLKSDGTAASPRSLNATIALPGKVAAIPLQFISLGDGKYVSSIDVPLAGTWTLDLRARRTAFDESAAETKIRFG